MKDRDQRVVVEGNDGTGKSTLVDSLRGLGFTNVVDRGEMTKATDKDTPKDPDSIYLLLTCPWEESRRRLIEAGEDMSDFYHSDESLSKYNKKFRELQPKFDAHVISTRSPQQTLQDAIRILEGGITIGLPKGRLAFKYNEELLSFIGVTALPKVLEREGRSLVCQDPTDARRTFLVGRAAAFPRMVALGFLDYAICGSDVITPDVEDQLTVLHKVPQKGVRIAVASATGTIPTKKLLRVATEFRGIASNYFAKRGIPHTIFDLNGCCEGFVPAFADVIVDIVESGETLRSNGLKIVDEILELDTCLITLEK